MNQLQDLYEYLNKASMSGMSERSANHVSAAIAIVKQMMQAEPVAWLVEFENGEQELHFNDTKESLGESQTPLYAAPQAVPAAPKGAV